MSSTSRRITNGDPSESSSTTALAEIVQDIIEDVSGDDDSTSNAQTNNKDDGPTNADDDDDGEQSKLTEFHAKTTLTLRWVGKIFVSYSLWQLDVTRWIYLTTKNLLFLDRKLTILKSNPIPPL